VAARDVTAAGRPAREAGAGPAVAAPAALGGRPDGDGDGDSTAAGRTAGAAVTAAVGPGPAVFASAPGPGSRTIKSTAATAPATANAAATAVRPARKLISSSHALTAARKPGRGLATRPLTPFTTSDDTDAPPAAAA
jgi:hypothetical protein